MSGERHEGHGPLRCHRDCPAYGAFMAEMHDQMRPTPEPSEVAETTAGERECRYPCGCDQFPEDHCACMDGHAPAEPDAGEVALTDAEWDDLRSENMYDTEESVRRFVDAVLAAHVSAAETKARAEERAEWSSWIDSWLGAVGPKPPTVEDVARVLRSGPRPFGCAASIARGDAR